MVRLGVTPETAYLYMRGHDLVDVVLGPILSAVCDVLRREREREITKLACHAVQQQNELAAYRHAVAPFEEMLRKHTAYHATPEFRRIVAAVRALFVDDPGAPADASSAVEGEFSSDAVRAALYNKESSVAEGELPSESAEFSEKMVRGTLAHRESSAEGADTTELAGTLSPTAGRLSEMFEPGEDWDTEVD